MYELNTSSNILDVLIIGKKLEKIGNILYSHLYQIGTGFKWFDSEHCLDFKDQQTGVHCQVSSNPLSTAKTSSSNPIYYRNSMTG